MVNEFLGTMNERPTIDEEFESVLDDRSKWFNGGELPSLLPDTDKNRPAEEGRGTGECRARQTNRG